MTGAQTLAAFRRAVIPALLAALVTLAAVVGLMLSRPPSYEVKASVIAKPAVGRTGTVDFGQVVGSLMPSLPEFVVSDDVVRAIGDQVPQAPSNDDLRSAVTVELVPASGVARISVTTDDPATSKAVLAVVLQQIRSADLLSPVAVLQPIGASSPAATVVGRDPLLAIGLGLVASIAVSLLTVVLVQTLRPRLLTRPDVERIVDGVFDGEPPPPVVEVHVDGRGVDLLAAYLLAQDPDVLEVKVVASGPGLKGDFGTQLASSLRKVRAAREAGLALDPFGEASTPMPTAGRLQARHRTQGGLPGHEFDDVELAWSPTRTGTATDRARSNAPTLAGGIAVPVQAGEPQQEAHLVLTVRLRRTTPAALTTALITLRSHGTGVAGVAVS